MREDPGLYDYWPYEGRPALRWPNGARVAFWVAPNPDDGGLQFAAIAFRGTVTVEDMKAVRAST